MTSPTAARQRRRPYTMRRVTAAASTRRSTWPGMVAFCRVIATMASSRSVSPKGRRYRSPSPLVMRTRGANSLNWLTSRKVPVTANAKASRSRRSHWRPSNVQRYEALFEIERQINGLSDEERLAARQEKSKPLFDDMHAWLKRERATLSNSSEVIGPIDYMLMRWDGLPVFSKTAGFVSRTMRPSAL